MATRAQIRTALAVCSLALVVGACSKDKKGATSRDGVVEAWKKGGLQPSELKATKTDIGKDCAAGTVNKIDVLVCEFASEKDAVAAEDAGLAWIGDTTGVSKAVGEMLIVAADRKKADVNGKVMNQLITLPAK
jgi:hypothetical protein